MKIIMNNKILSLVILVALLSVVVFLGVFKGKVKQSDLVELKIPHYKAGENVGAKLFLPMVDRFNQKYEGKYKITIEELPQDQYHNKIKLLQQQNKIPALVEGADKVYMEDVLLKNDLVYDLSTWLDSKPEVKSRLVKSSLEYNTKADGKVVTLPWAIIKPIGLYYNKEIFQKSGIEKNVADMTFEEFDIALAKIKSAGFSPLALMTSENAWTTSLLFSAMFANEKGGEELLNSYETQYDFTSKIWVDAFTKLQTYLMKFATDNAIGAAYADAANQFLNGKAAIIANGPWMVGDFSDITKTSEGFDKIVGATVYPKGIVLGDTRGYGWWIPKALPQNEVEAALAFLEFMYSPFEIEKTIILEGGTAPNTQLSDDFSSKLNPIIAELNSSIIDKSNTTVSLIFSLFPDQIAAAEFGKLIPKLANGSMTPKSFGEALSKTAQKFK